MSKRSASVVSSRSWPGGKGQCEDLATQAFRTRFSSRFPALVSLQSRQTLRSLSFADAALGQKTQGYAQCNFSA